MKRIFIVDDDIQVLASLEKVLSQEGFYVKAVDNGEKAVEIIKNENFHLAIIDIIMPGMDGLEVLEKIKKFSPETVVFAFTGYPLNSIKVKAKALGAKEVIIKPCDKDELIFLKLKFLK